MAVASGIAKVITRVKLGQDDGDVAYWQSQPPEARLAALEEIRREYHLWKYGGEPPFRKVVTIINRDGEVLRRWGETEKMIRSDEKSSTLIWCDDNEGQIMYTTYRLKANDLNSQFLESLKTLFRDQEVEITVTPVDETAYLLRSEANALRLREAISNVNAGRNLVEVSTDALK